MALRRGMKTSGRGIADRQVDKVMSRNADGITSLPHHTLRRSASAGIHSVRQTRTRGRGRGRRVGGSAGGVGEVVERVEVRRGRGRGRKPTSFPNETFRKNLKRPTVSSDRRTEESTSVEKTKPRSIAAHNSVAIKRKYDSDSSASSSNNIVSERAKKKRRISAEEVEQTGGINGKPLPNKKIRKVNKGRKQILVNEEQKNEEKIKNHQECSASSRTNSSDSDSTVGNSRTTGRKDPTTKAKFLTKVNNKKLKNTNMKNAKGSKATMKNKLVKKRTDSKFAGMSDEKAEEIKRIVTWQPSRRVASMNATAVMQCILVKEFPKPSAKTPKVTVKDVSTAEKRSDPSMKVSPAGGSSGSRNFKKEILNKINNDASNVTITSKNKKKEINIGAKDNKSLPPKKRKPSKVVHRERTRKKSNACTEVVPQPSSSRRLASLNASAIISACYTANAVREEESSVSVVRQNQIAIVDRTSGSDIIGTSPRDNLNRVPVGTTRVRRVRVASRHSRSTSDCSASIVTQDTKTPEAPVILPTPVLPPFVENHMNKVDAIPADSDVTITGMHYVATCTANNHVTNVHSYQISSRPRLPLVSVPEPSQFQILPLSNSQQVLRHVHASDGSYPPRHALNSAPAHRPEGEGQGILAVTPSFAPLTPIAANTGYRLPTAVDASHARTANNMDSSAVAVQPNYFDMYHRPIMQQPPMESTPFMFPSYYLPPPPQSHASPYVPPPFAVHPHWLGPYPAAPGYPRFFAHPHYHAPYQQSFIFPQVPCHDPLQQQQQQQQPQQQPYDQQRQQQQLYNNHQHQQQHQQLPQQSNRTVDLSTTPVPTYTHSSAPPADTPNYVVASSTAGPTPRTVDVGVGLSPPGSEVQSTVQSFCSPMSSVMCSTNVASTATHEAGQPVVAGIVSPRTVAPGVVMQHGYTAATKEAASSIHNPPCLVSVPCKSNYKNSCGTQSVSTNSRAGNCEEQRPHDVFNNRNTLHPTPSCTVRSTGTSFVRAPSTKMVSSTGVKPLPICSSQRTTGNVIGENLRSWSGINHNANHLSHKPVPVSQDSGSFRSGQNVTQPSATIGTGCQQLQKHPSTMYSSMHRSTQPLESSSTTRLPPSTSTAPFSSTFYKLPKASSTPTSTSHFRPIRPAPYDKVEGSTMVVPRHLNAPPMPRQQIDRRRPLPLSRPSLYSCVPSSSTTGSDGRGPAAGGVDAGTSRYDAAVMETIERVCSGHGEIVGADMEVVKLHSNRPMCYNHTFPQVQQQQFTTPLSSASFSGCIKLDAAVTSVVSRASDVVLTASSGHNSCTHLPDKTTSEETSKAVEVEAVSLPVQKSRVRRVPGLTARASVSPDLPTPSPVCLPPVGVMGRRRSRKPSKRSEGAVGDSSTLNSISKPRRLRWSHAWSVQGEGRPRQTLLSNNRCPVERFCYSSIKHREGDVINEGDCVLLRPGQDSHLPYVARVVDIFVDPDYDELLISLLWYYRPDLSPPVQSTNTDGGVAEDEASSGERGSCEVYASRHRDVSSVACIEDKCYVLTWNEYSRYCRFLAQCRDGVQNVIGVVPDLTEDYPRISRLPSERVAPDRIFHCSRVYDYRTGRLLKNPC